MTAKSRNSGQQGVPSAVIIGVIVLAVVFVGWLAYANLFAPPKPAAMSGEGKQNQSVLADLAKKCQGDFSKLSPEDQQTATKMAGGYASAAIANLYKNPTMGR